VNAMESTNPDLGSRIETDALGALELPADSLVGIQTRRAVGNFAISGLPIRQHPDLIRALAMVKRAAATANLRLGLLDERVGAAIIAACDAVIAGAHHEAFVVDVFQGGAGTSTNMNMNEVIANLALDRLGAPRGSYDIVSPHDHVNRSQSTNDVYPTAARLSLLFAHERFAADLSGLAQAFRAKAALFQGVRKLGRTQLQDAVAMTVGQEFGAFATALQEDVARSAEIARLFLEINLGGTAIGTGLNAPPAYAGIAIAALSKLSGFEMRAAENLIEASWDMGAFVLFSGMLKRTAVKLSKIANDLRLLGSGPRGGLGEIRLPALQPGSSMMPGKVNPVLPEVVSQVCFQVIGNDLAVTLAAEAGQLQLNAMEPLIVHDLHQGLALLSSTMRAFSRLCVEGIEVDGAKCDEHLNRSLSSATSLVPLIGYEKAAELAKRALAEGRTIEDLAAAELGVPSR